MIYRYARESQLPFILAQRWERQLLPTAGAVGTCHASHQEREALALGARFVLCCFLHVRSRKPQPLSLLPKAPAATGQLYPPSLEELRVGLYKEKGML